MNVEMILLITVIIALFVMMFIGLIVFIGLLASTKRTVQSLRAEIVEHRKINAIMVAALRTQSTIMVRYERNLAVWFNMQTGERWEFDKKSRDLYAGMLKDIDDQIKIAGENVDVKLKKI